jgi:hypothetical protein
MSELDPHEVAMNLAEEALILKMQNKMDASAKKFKQAFELEAVAASQYQNAYDEEPTRSVLFRSAAALAYNAGAFREAEKMIGHLLSGNPPTDIADEGRNLYEKVNFERHLSIKGIKLYDTDIQMSLAGNSVSLGMVRSEEFLKRAEVFDSMAIRTAERLLGRPFRERGRIPKDIRDNFATYYSVPRAASFAITLRVGYTEKQPPLLGENIQGAIVSDILENIKIINNRDERYLKQKIDNEDYYSNIIGLIKKMSPDSKDVTMVGLSTMQYNREESVAFVRSCDDIHISSLQPGSDEAIDEITITGKLNYANADNHDIRLLSEDGDSYKVIVPKGILGDIVKPYWEQIVTIKGKVKENKIYFEDLINSK